MNGVYRGFLSPYEFSPVSKFQCSRPDLESLNFFCGIAGVRGFRAGLPEVRMAASHCGGLGLGKSGWEERNEV